MEVDQESSIRLQAQTGLNTRLTRQPTSLSQQPKPLQNTCKTHTGQHPLLHNTAVNLTPITSAELKAALKEFARNKAHGTRQPPS